MKKEKRFAVLLSVVLLFGVLLSCADKEEHRPYGLLDIYDNGFSSTYPSVCSFYVVDGFYSVLLPQGGSGCGPVVFNDAESGIHSDLDFSAASGFNICVKIVRYESSAKWNYRVGVRDTSENWYICDVSLLTDHCEIDRGSAVNFDTFGLRTKNRIAGAIGGISNLRIHKSFYPCQ